LQEELDKGGHRYRVVNAGVSGDTTGGGLGRLKPALALNPSIVILELGGNDGLQGLPTDSTRANLDEIITAFRGGGARVILAGITLPRNFGPDYIASFDRIFPDLAKKHRVPLIPFFLEGVAAHPDLVLDDGIHPNADGYRVVTSTVMTHLEPMLREK
jgi:acyl-CoA thioesterase-1